ncbi:hypothetical protein [Marinimicrobium sp. ABcell2]|uniref:hypothetical protein n=1 Tax=Marinimicrobium sp. ABcell2 TaxID=3069751 RepID=UPI0027AFD995|nr:hypothetical protein [Marinimicrobium sp. ABcell2]MDQ2075951.1 hypothetical protein [Marinimicrobium sp. ABcell2]
MRFLAEFIMRGRTQAAVVALIGNWVPLIAPGAVALVTLRAGASNGLLVLLWALLPAALMLGFSQIDPLAPVIMISGLVVTFLLASMLRAQVSWSQCLMAAVALGMLAALLQRMLVPDLVQALADNLARVMEQIHEQAGSEAVPPGPSVVLVTGLLANVISFSSVLGLILGRWWQGLLYNPGGFAQEFQCLRLNAPQALVCLGAGLYSLLQGPEYAWWGALFTLPLLFVGLAIVHRLVALKGLGVHWLVVMYIALVVLDPVSQLLVALAFVDTWLNIRGRVKPKPEV